MKGGDGQTPLLSGGLSWALKMSDLVAAFKAYLATHIEQFSSLPLVIEIGSVQAFSNSSGESLEEKRLGMSVDHGANVPGEVLPFDVMSGKRR